MTLRQHHYKHMKLSSGLHRNYISYTRKVHIILIDLRLRLLLKISLLKLHNFFFNYLSHHSVYEAEQ